MPANSSPSVEALYLRRPTPEYAHAFDVFAQAVAHSHGPVLAVMSSPVHAVELLKRCPQPLSFLNTPQFNANQFIAEAAGWAWGALQAVTSPTDTYATILWAEPDESEATDLLPVFKAVSTPNTTLLIISSGFLRRYLPAWQAQPHPTQRPMPPGAVLHALRRQGWQAHPLHAWHGPRAMFWSGLYRMAEILQRPDLSDRCLFAMRAHYREPGWWWPVTPVALIQAWAIKQVGGFISYAP